MLPSTTTGREVSLDVVLRRFMRFRSALNFQASIFDSPFPAALPTATHTEGSTTG
jgi:hypothetical protein